MTFPAIPIAFTGVPLQRPNADLPQIAGPSGVAVQTFGALLAGLALHPDRRAPLLDAATLGADPVPETTPPDPGDLAQSAGAAEVPAQTEDAETAYVFHGLDGPEGAETAAISAPDFSAAPVPVTLNLAVSVPSQPPLPEAGAQDTAAPENPQLGAILRPVVGGRKWLKCPACRCLAPRRAVQGHLCQCPPRWVWVASGGPRLPLPPCPLIELLRRRRGFWCLWQMVIPPSPRRPLWPLRPAPAHTQRASGPQACLHRSPLCPRQPCPALPQRRRIWRNQHPGLWPQRRKWQPPPLLRPRAAPQPCIARANQTTPMLPKF